MARSQEELEKGCGVAVFP